MRCTLRGGIWGSETIQITPSIPDDDLGTIWKRAWCKKGSVDEQRRAYFSCLLRLRRVREHGRWIWRASLENAESGERISFPDLDSLIAYLQSETRAETPEEGNNPESA